jgi:hypothetical protein
MDDFDIEAWQARSCPGDIDFGLLSAVLWA